MHYGSTGTNVTLVVHVLGVYYTYKYYKELHVHVNNGISMANLDNIADLFQ